MTAPFMVIDTDILSSGIPSNKAFISSTESWNTFQKLDNNTKFMIVYKSQIQETYNSNPSHPHISFYSEIVRIITAMGCQIESNAKSLLPSFDIFPVKSIAFFHRRKSSILLPLKISIILSLSAIFPSRKLLITCLIVHGLWEYIVGYGPRVKGNFPGNSFPKLKIVRHSSKRLLHQFWSILFRLTL